MFRPVGTFAILLLLFGGLSGCTSEGRRLVDGSPDLIAYDASPEPDSTMFEDQDGNNENPDFVENDASRVEPACITVSPLQVNFGGKKYGEEASQEIRIGSCSDTPLEIFDIRLKEGSSPEFGVVLTNDDGQKLLDHEPTQENPVIVLTGNDTSILVTYLPSADGPDAHVGGGEGELVIKSNASKETKIIRLQAAFVEPSSPTAMIGCKEGHEVIPQTKLHFSGDESSAGYGEIDQWEWSVEQPTGSQSKFIPSNDQPNPTFEANVAGSYVFTLDVWDENGLRSSMPATYEVIVIPDQAIHIELLWHNPEDLDESDTGPQAGSDLDLHFLHPWAGGPDLDLDGNPDGWFDLLFDCFWFNAYPNWGSYDPAIDDDPALDRDDTDGAGPENLNLDIPEENVTYRVGVHYFNDHGYGPAYATVRVYIYSYLVFEALDVMLVDKDMWEVCTVQWPSGQVLPVLLESGSHKITPQYENSYVFQD